MFSYAKPSKTSVIQTRSVDHVVQAKNAKQINKVIESTPSKNLFESNLTRISSASPSTSLSASRSTVALQRLIRPNRTTLNSPSTPLSREQSMHTHAEKGVQGLGQRLPHFERIQKAFGQHDLSHVRAYTNSAAQMAAKRIQAEAYATGNKIAFANSNPSLHTVAHETTHVLQQQKGVHLKGGIGHKGDVYERQADQVADAVVTGRSIPNSISQQLSVPTISSTLSAPKTIQRKVKNGIYSPEPNVETIKGILNSSTDKRLQNVYDIPSEFNIPNKLDRAKKVSADVWLNSDNKRGSGGDYKKIGDLGKWEKQAVSANTNTKTIDVGHLIADKFFSKEQKKEAYKAANLAPQIAPFNEDTYQNIVENPIENLDDVHLTVELKYDPDLSSPVDVLVQRGTLDVIDAAQHQKNVKKNFKIDIPRRLPRKWTAKFSSSDSLDPKKTIVPKPAAQDHPVKKARKRGRTEFTSEVPFVTGEYDFDPSSTTGKGKKMVTTPNALTIPFYQGYPNEDIEAKQNPTHISGSEEAQWTDQQLKRRKITLDGSQINKLTVAIIQARQQIITNNATGTNPPLTPINDTDFTNVIVLINTWSSLKTSLTSWNDALRKILKKLNFATGSPEADIIESEIVEVIEADEQKLTGSFFIK